MRILLINEVCGHTSTGRICSEIAEKYEAGGHTVKIAYGRSPYVPKQYQKFAVQIGNSWDVRLHALQTRLSDRHGFGSRKATEKFLSQRAFARSRPPRRERDDLWRRRKGPAHACSCPTMRYVTVRAAGAESSARAGSAGTKTWRKPCGRFRGFSRRKMFLRCACCPIPIACA